MAPNNRLIAEQLIRDSPVEEIRRNLLEWWSSVGRRNFPWRYTHDPFKIILAEILLHRTRAEQVVPLYLLFFDGIDRIYKIKSSYYPAKPLGHPLCGCPNDISLEIMGSPVRKNK